MTDTQSQVVIFQSDQLLKAPSLGVALSASSASWLPCNALRLPQKDSSVTKKLCTFITNFGVC